VLNPGPISPSGPDHGPVDFRALVIDDESLLPQLISFVLHSFVGAHSDAAMASGQSMQPDIALLEVMLPDISSHGVLAGLPATQANAPVLLITARDSVEDRIAALRADGNGYAVELLSPEEAVSRTRSILRRADVTAMSANNERIVVGDLVLDEITREVTHSGAPITLTFTEFRLLRFLMSNSRQVLSKAYILKHIWGLDFDPKSNLVAFYVSSLRAKIDREGQSMIHTVRGLGYVLKAPD
jgi:two-component system OmpR family response regulator